MERIAERSGTVERTERTPAGLFTPGPAKPIRARFDGLVSSAVRPIVRFGRVLLSLSHRQKRIIMMAADGVMLLIALSGALAVSRSESVHPTGSIWLIATVSIITIPIFARMGLYRTVIHYLGEQAIFAVVQAVFLSAFVLGAVITIADIRDVSITAVFAYCVMAFPLIGGSRLAMRVYFRAVAGTAKKRI